MAIQKKSVTRAVKTTGKPKALSAPPSNNGSTTRKAIVRLRKAGGQGDPY